MYIFLIHCILHPGDADYVDDIISECDCSIESILEMEKSIVQGNLHGRNTSILTLEHTILDLSSNPQLTQAVFYMLPIDTNGKLYIRYVNAYFTHITHITHPKLN